MAQQQQRGRKIKTFDIEMYEIIGNFIFSVNFSYLSLAYINEYISVSDVIYNIHICI